MTGSYRSAAAGTSPSESPLRTSPEKGEGSPSAAVLHTKQIKPRNSCALRAALLCNPSFLSSLRAHGLLGGVICALNFGLQATAEEQHLAAKINKRQAPESFLPAPARRQEGMAPGQHRAHPAVLPPAPAARERGEGLLPPTAGVLVCSVSTHRLSNAFNAEIWWMEVIKDPLDISGRHTLAFCHSLGIQTLTQLGRSLNYEK